MRQARSRERMVAGVLLVGLLLAGLSGCVGTPPSTVLPTPEATAAQVAASGVAAPIPHPVGGREDCLQCHDVPNGQANVPPDHEGRGNDTCVMCHRVEGGGSGATGLAVGHPIAEHNDCVSCHAPDSNWKPAPPDHEGRTNDTCLSCHPPAAGDSGPVGLSIPHPIAKQNDCVSCHATDSTWKPAPPDHEGRANDTCLSCHPPSVDEGATSAPASGASMGTGDGGISPIPHPVAGQEECSKCHAVDSPLKPAPADHEGRSDDTCQACHKPAAAEAGVTPAAAGAGASATEAPVAEAEEMKAADCLACHGPLDALAAKTAEFQTEDGEQINPHMTVPHDSEKPAECSNCHEPHAIPPSADYEAEADLEWCTGACHHTGTYQPCSECHQE